MCYIGRFIFTNRHERFVMKNRVGILAALLCASVAFSGPYDSWSNFRMVSVNTGTAGVSGAVANYPLLVRLSNASTATGSDVLAGALAGGADIRFADATGATALPCQIEQWSAASAAIWVLVPSMAGGATTSIRMYWGKSGSTGASNGGAVFDTAKSFVGVWHLGEATDSAALDATINHFHGAPGQVGGRGVPQDTLGLIGQAKSFRGVYSGGDGTTGSYYAMDGTASGSVNTVTGPLNFPAGGPYTISAWVRGYVAASSMIAGKGEGQYFFGKRGYGANWNNDDMNGSSQKIVYASASGSLGVWTHVAVARTSSTTAKLFVNGAPIAARDSTGALTNRNTTGAFNIGGHDQTNTTKVFCFPGAIDEVEVSNVARDSNWIKLNYETQKTDQTAVTLGTPGGILDFSARHDGFGIHMIGSSVVFRLPPGLAAGARVSVTDVWGRTVWSRTVVVGTGELSWNGKAGGNIAAHGIYFVRLSANADGKSRVIAESKLSILP
jgi:biopolymer transport protein ExbB